VTQPQVRSGPDVPQAKREQLHAVGGEPADALDLRELVPGGVVQGAQPLEVEPSVDQALSYS
jgi:hypothetical protein